MYNDCLIVYLGWNGYIGFNLFICLDICMYIMFCCYFVVVILVCVSVGLVIVWVGVCDDFNWFI